MKKMAKLRFLFYLAKVDGKLLDDILSLYSGLFPCNWGSEGYSHAEIWFPDSGGRFVDEEDGSYCGITFSSTMRGDVNGTRFEIASVLLRHPERWDWIEIEVTKEQLELAHRVACEELGKKYDLLGILGFVIPGIYNPDDKWYCSEVVAYIAYRIWILNKHHTTISPRRLSKKINQVKEKQQELRGLNDGLLLPPEDNI